MTEGVASILIDHGKKRAGIRAAGAVSWCPAAFYEPLARLANKYAAMDGAMRRWQAMVDEVQARTDAR